MTNYYLLENGIITQSSNFKFDDNCLETEEDIVRDELSGKLYLQSDYNSLIATHDYKAKKTAQENAIKKADLQSQIDELDKKRVRAGFEPSVKDSSTGQTWLEYYTAQITNLRVQITNLG